MKPKAHAFLCQIHNIKPVNDQSWSRNTDLVEKLMQRLTDVSAEEKMFARFKVCFGTKLLNLLLKINLELKISAENWFVSLRK